MFMYYYYYCTRCLYIAWGIGADSGGGVAEGLVGGWVVHKSWLPHLLLDQYLEHNTQRCFVKPNFHLKNNIGTKL